jgi:hypothetical protein
MFVKPGTSRRDGSAVKVRVPRTRAIVPDSGMEVPGTHFWLRRLRDGDVVIVEQPAPTPAAPAPTTLVTPAAAQQQEH